MSKRAPSTAQLLVIAGFALSCFGILLFLWITFGGPTPFKAKPYEIKVLFQEATQLAQQSDVRISGVSVGKVQNIEVSPDGQQAVATIDIEDKYGPIPKGTRAVLRTKTLLGETYVELTPGDADGPVLPDGATLARANVAESVQLDEIFRTFDKPTRAAFQEWMQEGAVAISGQGQSFSNALGELDPFFSEFDRLFRLLDTQRLAVEQLFSNGAVSLRALRGREGQLAELIDNSNDVFRTTAARNRDIEALFRVFPTFQDEQRLTFDRLKEFALNADPLFRQLVPAAEQLSPTLIALSRFAPQAKGFFEGLEPVIDRAPSGFGSLRKFLRKDFPVLLRAVDPFLRNLNPILTGLGLYKREVTSLFGNVAAATNAVHLNSQGEQVHV
jgi:ABC-type transporter Mla subunit MlaD